ncbi:MAG: hypothetical protein LBD22_06435 [Spirochaetaceae bacterium]|jgi:hypothetical protein|nr:hypothetical protein [Spirochaetaceae bacterium]
MQFKIWLIAGTLLTIQLLAAQDDGGAELRSGILDTEARRRSVEREASPQLFAINLFDADVSLLLSGYWKGTFTGAWGIKNSKFGWGIASVESPLLFEQEADLTLSLWIKERWFIETSFQEDYNINTYRAGYKGRDGDFVRYAGIGNTGLSFPLFPYLDLGGDSASSLGFYGAFGSGPLTLHTLIRYDTAEREERIFVGGRERSYTELSVAMQLHGVSFVLPAENLSALPVIYLEDNEGTLSGGGTRWRIARPSEAAVSSRDGIVELTAPPAGMAAVSYPGGYNLGSYGDGAVGGSNGASGFLGEAQTFFDGIALKNYPQPGNRGGSATAPQIILIDGISSLVIFEKGTFSPFERQSRYSAPVSTATSATLIKSSTKDVVQGWDVHKLDDSPLLTLPLYVNEETKAKTYRRDTYEITRNGEDSSRSPRSRWPLGEDEQGRPWLLSIYLPGNSTREHDVELRWTSWSDQTGYRLGSDVLPGSVQVLRGGITDSNWVFDEASGTIRLSLPAQFNEVIRISYLRKSLDRRNGSIAAGLGAVYEGEGRLSARGALGIRWNLSSDSFSQAGVMSPGLAGFGGKISWNGAQIKADMSLGAGYEQPDTTGLYRAAGMEGHETIYDLPDNSFISHPEELQTAVPPLAPLTLDKRGSLAYRNYRETNFAGITVLKPIESDVPVETALSGPYPARDGTFNTRILAAEFNLDGTGIVWTGFQSPLADGNSIAQAEEILIPFRFYDLYTMANLRLFVQFGTLTAKDSMAWENPSLIVERELTSTIPVPPSSQAAIATIKLSGDERRKLGSATGIRFIIVSDGAAAGRFLAAPPVFRGAAFAPLTAASTGILDNPDLLPVSAVETSDPATPSLSEKYSALMNRLHGTGERQRILNVSWTGPIDSGLAVGAGGRIGKLPLSTYKKLSFFIKIPDPALTGAQTFDLYAARGKSSFNKSSELALEAHIPAQSLCPGGSEGWVKVEIDWSTETYGIYVEGARINGAYFDYRPGVLQKRGAQVQDEGEGEDDAYLMFFLSPGSNGILTGSNQFLIDEILLEEGNPSFYFNSGLRLNWSRPGTLVKSNNIPILADGNFETALESSTRGSPSDNSTAVFAGVVTRSRAGISLLGIKLSGDLAFQTSSGDTGHVAWWTAGHGISRTLGPLVLRERFFLDPEGAVWNHDAGIGLSGTYHALFNASGSHLNGITSRTWQSGLGRRATEKLPFSAAITTRWRWTERAAATEDDDVFAAGYGRAWWASAEALLPDSGTNAETRSMDSNLDLRFNGKNAGAALTIRANQDASLPARKTTSGGRLQLDVPWQASFLRGSAKFERAYERGSTRIHQNAAGDLEEFRAAFNESGALVGALPLYTLFDPRLAEKLSSVLDHSGETGVSGGRFSDRYSYSMRLPVRKDLFALIIPYDFDAHIDRSVIRQLDTMQDILGFGGNVRFSAQNLFGAFGRLKQFEFYQNDEFRHGLGTAVAIPRNDEVSWRVYAEQSAAFYGFRGSQFKIHDILTVLSTGWLVNVTLELQTPAEKSFVSTLYQWFMRRFENSTYSPALASLAAAACDRLRKEKIDISLDSNPSNFRWTVSARHESIVRITGRLDLSAFIMLLCAQDSYFDELSFIATVGTSLKISF